MKYIISLLLFVFCFASVLLFQKPHQQFIPKSNELPPHEYLLSRNFPNIGEGENAYKLATQKALYQMGKYRNANTAWTQEGPFNIGGRINCIAIDPNNTNIIYVGTPNAGIWKSTDGGANWVQKFNSGNYLAIGAICIDPNNTSIIYVGTGDEAMSSFTYLGDGIYKSTDGGNTWQNLGLQNTGVISEISINPSNPNIIYVGTLGNIYNLNSNRGLYKTINGGNTWNQILYLGSDAGIGDIEMNNTNPDNLFVTGKTRYRTNAGSFVSGKKTKIYRTFNGGTSWDTLSNGLPSDSNCKITLALSQLNPQLIYASYIDTASEFGGIYKSTNAGTNWSLVYSGNQLNAGGFGWYFGKIKLSPSNDNILYWMGVDLFRSTNGGVTWSYNAPQWYTYDVHADKHDLQFINANTFLLATDGGIYKTTNGGGQNASAWQNLTNMPITQFYRVAYNKYDPSNYYGGAQDNGTEKGSLANGLNNWVRYFGGDGFKPSFDSTNQNIMYAQTQNGNINATSDGGFNWDPITTSLLATDRTGWNTPYFISPHNHFTAFVGTYKLYKNTYSLFDSWQAISGDLTDGTNDKHHYISSIDQSPIFDQRLCAGTSDGKVWITTTGGTSWNLVNAGLPNRYVSCIKASPNSASTFFLSYWGYRDNDTTAYIYYTNNNGSNWINIANSTLPNFAINDIWIKKDGRDSAVVIATDGGVYSTNNLGTNWYRVGNNMPIIPVYDIEYNPSNNKIFIGTFAMSIMSMSLDSVFTTTTPITNIAVNDHKNDNSEILIYPNPCSDFINIISKEKIKTISILDINGKIIYQKQVVKEPYKIAINTLPKAMYFAKIETEKGIEIKKFLKD